MSTLAHLLVDLLSTAPPLVPIYREHLALHDALVPEVFMSQITAWLSGTANTPGAGKIEGGASGEAAKTVVGVFENHLASGDADVRELIALSPLIVIPRSEATRDLLCDSYSLPRL